MDPLENSKLFHKFTSPNYQLQGASTSTTAGDPAMQKTSANSDSPGITGSVSPIVSDNIRQSPISTQTAVHSFLYNVSNNVGGIVEMGNPHVPLVAGHNSMTSVSNLTDPFVQNARRQTLDNLQSANLLSLLGSQFPTFPTLPAAPNHGLPSIGTPPQLLQTSSTPFLATLMQQLLCSSMNVAPVAPPPVNNSNLVAQLIVQLLNAHLVQSAQPGPLAGLLQLIQALSSMTGSASAATCFQTSSQTSILSHLSSLDPATAKQVILMLVKQLIQSGNLIDDETSQRFVEKLMVTPYSTPWMPTQSAANSNWLTVQNMSATSITSPDNGPVAPGNIKKETISSSDKDSREGFEVSINISASPSPGSDDDGTSVTPVRDAMPSTYSTKADSASDQSDAEMNGGESTGCQTQQMTHANGSRRNSTKSRKHARNATSKKVRSVYRKRDSGKANTRVEPVGKGRSENNSKAAVKVDVTESPDLPEEQQTSGKRLRSRSKTVTYCEEELTEVPEQSDDESDARSKKKKLNSRARSNGQKSVAKESKTSRSISSGLTQSSSNLAAAVASGRNGGNSQAVVKSEITGPICVLPMLNTCHSPNVRYLFMGRKSDGMDWLNLVSYKIMGSDDSVNQCLFCPMTSLEVKPVADHIANEHGDLDFVLTNIKQPNGRVMYLACRHCNYVTFEPTLMWIHFELYHGIPGIMDGSSLPQINISDTVNVEEVSLDEPVNSRGCQPAYVCLDCMLCSNNSKNVAMHVIQAHPDTANFNGCFVKLMMIKTKEKDCFTFSEALYDESHAEALKDVYVCMLCEYSTHGAYLAMSHSLRLHQTKRLLFVCNECEYQCTRETNLLMHMASSHKVSSITSFICSVTLIASLTDDTFTECTFPVKAQKITDQSKSGSDCEMKSRSILQSTAVSSSQEKQKLHLLSVCEESAVAPQSDCKIGLVGQDVIKS